LLIFLTFSFTFYVPPFRHLTVTSAAICCHDVFVHWHGSYTLFFIVVQIGVRTWSSSKNYSEHSCRKWSLKGLFTLTCRNCNCEAILPG
jgi:hypothetical protein